MTLSIFLLASSLALQTGAPPPSPPHVQRASYVYVDSETRAEVQVTNVSPLPITVSPTLWVRGRYPVDVAPLELAPWTIAHIDVADALSEHEIEADPRWSSGGNRGNAEGRWGDGSLPGSVWASVELTSRDAFVAEPWTVSESRSLTVDTAFRETPGGVLAQDVWSRPTPDTRILFTMTNAGEAPIRVRAEIFQDGSWSLAPDALDLAGRETQLISLADLSPEPLGEAGSVRFVVVTGPPTLAVDKLTLDESTGLSVTSPMREALARPEGTPVASASLSVGALGTAYFVPKLIVGNLDARREGRIRIRMTSSTTGAQFETEHRLPAARTEVLDLFELLAGGQGLSDVVSLRVESLTPAVQLAYELWTIDDSRTHPYDSAFYYPLQEVSPRPGRFAIPAFDLEDNKTTLASLLNTGKEFGEFRMLVHSESGRELYDMRTTLAPGETSLVDLRALRDGRVPDAFGRRLPRELQRGSLLITGPDDKLAHHAIVDVRMGTCLMDCIPWEWEPTFEDL